jgi:hypothetical protein
MDTYDGDNYNNGGYDGNDGENGSENAGYGNDARTRDFLAQPNPWCAGGKSGLSPDVAGSSSLTPPPPGWVGVAGSQRR